MYTQHAFENVRRDRPIGKDGQPLRTITLQVKGQDDVVRRLSWLEEGLSADDVLGSLEKAFLSLLTAEANSGK